MIADAQKQVENNQQSQNDFTEIISLDEIEETQPAPVDTEKTNQIINKETQKELTPIHHHSENNNESSSGDSEMEDIDINFFN